jgi:hypothetical protein
VTEVSTASSRAAIAGCERVQLTGGYCADPDADRQARAGKPDALGGQDQQPGQAASRNTISRTHSPGTITK